MLTDTPNHFNSPTSARSLRENIKQAQANDAYLRIYLQFGQQLFVDGWQNHVALNLLQGLSSLLSAQHALLAIENAGKLLVHCQIGQTLPVGSRIPMMGILATALKHPVRFAVHENKKTPLWTHADGEQQDCLIPIALGQHGKGVMAFSGKKLLINQAEIHVLEASAGLLGLTISQYEGQVRSEVDLSVLETLTPREREILALLPAGLSNNELASKLGIASGTAKIHVERVLNKLGVKDRTKAAVKAIELGYKS